MTSDTYSIPLQFKDDNRLLVGLSWDHNEDLESKYDDAPVPHDLDLSCVLISADGLVIDMITPVDPKYDKYKQQVFHTGDHQSGASDFNDEEIQVRFDHLDADIGYLVFLVSAKDGVKLSDVKKPSCTFFDGITLDSFAAVDLASFEEGEAGHYLAVGVVKREPGDNFSALKLLKQVLPYQEPYELQTKIQELI